MIRRLSWAVIATAIFTVPSALAQDALVEYLVDACESDIENYCSQVTPGNGRLLLCAAAHEDKITGQCQYALYRAASLLEQLSMAMNYVAQECESEIENLCSNVEIGEGRILLCLSENEEKVSDACKAAVADTVGE